MAKVPIDYIGYLQNVARWRPPLASASTQSGFTAVTHTGAGTGTITPSVVSTSLIQATATESNFMLKISTGGAVGTMQFQISTDGGNTYGSAVTPTASYAIATNVTVGLSGTFTLGDTYAFQCTDVPIAAFTDSSSNRHGLIVDHFGFPMGRHSQFREDWCGYSTGVAASQTSVAFATRWSATTGSTGSITINTPGATYPSPYLTLASGATSGSKAEMNVNGPIIHPSSTYSVSVLEFEWSLTAIGANNLNCWAGWAQGIPDVSGDFLGFFWSGGTLFWDGNGLATAVNFAPSASAVPNMRCRIEYGGSSTPLNGYVRAFINDALVFVDNTALNIPSHAVAPTFSAKASGASPTASMTVGSVLAAWNRWA